MSGTVIYVPPAVKHQCKPFMETQWIKSPMPNGSTEPIEVVPPVGTIWRCDCEKLWRVYPQRQRNIMAKGKWARAGLFTQLRVWWRFL